MFSYIPSVSYGSPRRIVSQLILVQLRQLLAVKLNAGKETVLLQGRT